MSVADRLCIRSRCRKPAKRYEVYVPVVVPFDEGTSIFGTNVMVAGGGGVIQRATLCDRHAERLGRKMKVTAVSNRVD